MESIGTLASGIAHDLNNILTPVLATAQLLQMKLTNLDDRSQQMLQVLEANAKRGAELVKQVLSFARGVEGKHTVLQTKHLIREIQHIARETFPKSIKVYTEIPEDLWTVTGNATQLHQVLMNLCVNARDAMPHGGTLNLVAENLTIDESYARVNLDANAGSYIAITVSDSGMGIPGEIIDRIFGPFYDKRGGQRYRIRAFDCVRNYQKSSWFYYGYQFNGRGDPVQDIFACGQVSQFLRRKHRESNVRTQ